MCRYPSVAFMEFYMRLSILLNSKCQRIYINYIFLNLLPYNIQKKKRLLKLFINLLIYYCIINLQYRVNDTSILKVD